MYNKANDELKEILITMGLWDALEDIEVSSISDLKTVTIWLRLVHLRASMDSSRQELIKELDMDNIEI